MTRAARAIKIACDNRKQISYRVNRPLEKIYELFVGTNETVRNIRVSVQRCSTVPEIEKASRNFEGFKFLGLSRLRVRFYIDFQDLSGKSQLFRYIHKTSLFGSKVLETCRLDYFFMLLLFLVLIRFILIIFVYKRSCDHERESLMDTFIMAHINANN